MTYSKAHQWFKKHKKLKGISFKSLGNDQNLLKQTCLPKQNLPHLNPRHALIWSFVTKHKLSTSHSFTTRPFSNNVEPHRQFSVAEPTRTLHNRPIDDYPSTPKSPTNSPSMSGLDNIASLDELRQVIENFDDCPLKALARKTVFSDGNPKSPVMFIGEAPGAEEDAQGLPFVGLSGQLLDRMMNAIGLDRTKAYISNIVPWRPPGNRTPSPIEIAQCLPFIQRHIEIVKPRIIVLVGATAVKALLQRQDGIMKLRGQWFSYATPKLESPIAALATFHPAYLLRSPGQKREVWKDMLMIQKKLNSFEEETSSHA